MNQIYEINILRKKLEVITQELLDQIQLRKNTVLQIEDLKEQGPYAHFDPQREIQVFTSLVSRLELLSVKELFAISLIWECHASQKNCYPQWSTQFHLKLKSDDFYLNGINPLMLKVVRPSLLDKIGLDSKWEFLLEI